MNDNDQIKLHDYFDNLLSHAEQKEFEETLLDKIDLAIDLGKLKNLQRNLRNLPSNFEPSETVIENIIASLLEEKEKLVSSESKVEPETKKALKKEKKEAKKKRIKKEHKGLKALTKFRLKRLFTFSIFLFIIGLFVAGYFYLQHENSSFPWNVSVLSKNASTELRKLESSGLNSDAHLVTSKNDIVKITIANNGIIELSGESEILVTSGTQLLNSIILEKGKLKFTPQIGNILFVLKHNDVNIQSRNSQFEITTSNITSSKLQILTNFIEIELNDITTKVPYNHTFQILDNSNISIPLISNASNKIKKLVSQFDIENNDKILKEILKLSTRYNAFTLHFIMQKVTPSNRELILEKLQKYFPLPNSITKIDILMLDNNALNTWWEEIYKTM